jgi:hypothetical protein
VHQRTLRGAGAELRAFRVALLCVIIAAACSPYHASDAPTDDAGGGTPPPPPAPPNVQPEGDAGSEAAPDADAASVDGGSFCVNQGAVTFCGDFDESPTDPVAGWDTKTVSAGAALSIDKAIFESAPQALHANTTTGDTACVARSFTVPAKVTIDVAFRVAALTTASFNVLLVGPSGPHPIYFFFDSVKCYFQSGPDDFSTFLSAPSTNTWHHLHLVVANGTTATGSFDGVPAWTAHLIKYPWPSPTIATLQVGIAGLTSPGPADAWIDDVVVRTE